MNDRPRHFIEPLITDLREFCIKWMDEKEVPKEARPILMSHVILKMYRSNFEMMARRVEK